MNSVSQYIFSWSSLDYGLSNNDTIKFKISTNRTKLLKISLWVAEPWKDSTPFCPIFTFNDTKSNPHSGCFLHVC